MEGAMEELRKAWYHMRLSVRHPTRVPTWDAIVLTAASPEQAQLYDWQLRRAKRMERISPSTIVLAVPDPEGARIGSGAATLFAIHSLMDHLLLSSQGLSESESSKGTCNQNIESTVFNMRILLVHAGGDSKRVPWANPLGKAFIPLPYLAEEDPDGPVPLLFDHILAVSSPVVKAFKNKGGLFIMTGDVLPCFNSSLVVFPDDGACVVTVPTTLDIVINHGVIVPSSNESNGFSGTKSLYTVGHLLQKPTLDELASNKAVRHDGRALLDTGIFAIRGKAWKDVIELSTSCPTLVYHLLFIKEEVSLYEDVAAAWVPKRHEWLKTRPLGSHLVSALGSQRLFTYCANDLLFLHFGTTGEVLDHLSGGNSGRPGRRHLSSIPASNFCDLATSAVILSSEISSRVSVGDDSLIFDSTLSSGVQIGSRCVVVGLHAQQERVACEENSQLFLIPDRHCLWEVPLLTSTERVILCCGIEDNPKIAVDRGGTFCGNVWHRVFSELGIDENDVWSHTRDTKCLWNARIFPILGKDESRELIMWLMGINSVQKDKMLGLWKSSKRISLEETHRKIDYQFLCTEVSNHRAKLAAGIAKACISYGLLGRNLARLCAEILEWKISGVNICKQFLTLCPDPQTKTLINLPKSRAYQAQTDLYKACGEETRAVAVEKMAWEAVAAETAKAVKQDVVDQPLKLNSRVTSRVFHENGNNIVVVGSFHVRKAHIELPVRVDFVGGWSDTPPWSLERTGCVLNMGIHLNGICPVGAEILVTSNDGILISDDSGNTLLMNDIKSLAPPFQEGDKFRLVKAALVVTGITDLPQNAGLEIKTWAHVPRGSGLGTSSILAAAVVKGLLQVIGGDESNENVARLVLVLEQLMGTGGGWQDQIGGLYPGIKCTTSLPGKPLRLNVETVFVTSQVHLELEQRMLVVFTGQVRLAHQVLQKVVVRYLQRDAYLINCIKELARLAKVGRELLMNGNLDGLGRVMVDAWRMHQELDPYCSNEFVDKLFEHVKHLCCGYKLVGAGGGGFALLLAKDKEAAENLRSILKASEFPVEIYDWSIC